MTKEFIAKLEEYLSEIVDYLEHNTKNNIEKINILTKAVNVNKFLDKNVNFKVGHL